MGVALTTFGIHIAGRLDVPSPPVVLAALAVIAALIAATTLRAGPIGDIRARRGIRALSTDMIDDPNAVAPADLADLVAHLRRSMRRAARRAAPDLDLSVAQLELMTAIEAMPSARSGELAQSLRIAPNSVSTLTNGLVRLGMLERQRGTTDRRTVELTLTERGRASLTRWHATNEEMVSRALASMPIADQRRIQHALTSLRRFVERLDAQADDP